MGEKSVIFLLLLFSKLATAETVTQDAKLNIGITAGLNYAGYNASSNFYEHSKNGLIIGGLLEYHLTNIFSIESGIVLVNAGGKSDAIEGRDENAVKVEKFYVIQDLYYLEFPFMLKLHFPQESISLFLIGGPNIGVLVSAKDKLDADFSFPGESTSYDIKDRLNPFNMAFEVGIGVKVSIAQRIELETNGRYVFGISNQIKNKSNSFHLSQKTKNFRWYTKISIAI